MLRSLFFSVALLCASNCGAAIMVFQTSGIPSFDTNLGTLLSATVTIDPMTQLTEDYDADPFQNFGSHFHIVDPLPITVTGLDTYDFGPVQTSVVNPSTGADHNHSFDLPALTETYTGGALSWFLDPMNGVNSLNVLVPATSMADDHNHLVNSFQVTPTTRFVYDDTIIPEPSAVALVVLAMAPLCGRRRG